MKKYSIFSIPDPLCDTYIMSYPPDVAHSYRRYRDKQGPYQCVDCDKRYYQSYNLARHRQKYHGVPTLRKLMQLNKAARSRH